MTLTPAMMAKVKQNYWIELEPMAEKFMLEVPKPPKITGIQLYPLTRSHLTLVYLGRIDPRSASAAYHKLAYACEMQRNIRAKVVDIALYGHYQEKPALLFGGDGNDELVDLSEKARKICDTYGDKEQMYKWTISPHVAVGKIPFSRVDDKLVVPDHQPLIDSYIDQLREYFVGKRYEFFRMSLKRWPDPGIFRPKGGT